MRKLNNFAILAIAVAGIAGSVCQPVFAVEQPHMEATLRALEEARHEIDIADQAHDHGGHAGDATKAIDKAIDEVKKGIRYRNEHNH